MCSTYNFALKVNNLPMRLYENNWTILDQWKVWTSYTKALFRGLKAKTIFFRMFGFRKIDLDEGWLADAVNNIRIGKWCLSHIHTYYTNTETDTQSHTQIHIGRVK
jgi:hypothetical protein